MASSENHAGREGLDEWHLVTRWGRRPRSLLKAGRRPLAALRRLREGQLHSERTERFHVAPMLGRSAKGVFPANRNLPPRTRAGCASRGCRGSGGTAVERRRGDQMLPAEPIDASPSGRRSATERPLGLGERRTNAHGGSVPGAAATTRGETPASGVRQQTSGKQPTCRRWQSSACVRPVATLVALRAGCCRSSYLI